MGTIEFLREVITETHARFEATAGDVTQEQAHWRPPGIANPIAAVYAHVIVGADFGLPEPPMVSGESPLTDDAYLSIGLPPGGCNWPALRLFCSYNGKARATAA